MDDKAKVRRPLPDRGRLQSGPVTVLMIHGRGVSGPGEDWPDLLVAALSTVNPRGRGRAVRFIAPTYSFVTQGREEPDQGIDVTLHLARRPGKFRADRMTLVGDLRVLWGTTNLAFQPALVMSAGAAVMEAFTKDFTDYLRKPGVSRDVRAWLHKHVPAEGNLLVIGHSMGTLVALDLLHDLPQSVNVVGLITLGSPLAYKTFHELLPANYMPQALSRAALWVNLVDQQDLITGGAALVTSWPQAKGVVDIAVDNSQTLIPDEDRHSAAAYMRQPVFGLAVDRMISGRAWIGPGSSCRQLDVIGARLNGRSSGEVSLRARLEAVSRTRFGQGLFPADGSIADEPPMSSMSWRWIRGSLAGLAAALSGVAEVDKKHPNLALKAFVGELPFTKVVNRALESHSEHFRALSGLQSTYNGLPVSSVFWEDYVFGPYPVTARTMMWIGHPSQVPEPRSTDDEVLFLCLKLLIEADLEDAFMAAAHGTISRDISALYRNAQALYKALANFGLDSVSVRICEFTMTYIDALLTREWLSGEDRG